MDEIMAEFREKLKEATEDCAKQLYIRIPDAEPEVVMKKIMCRVIGEAATYYQSQHDKWSKDRR